MDIGNLIRTRRLQKRWSVKKLATRAGVSYNTVVNIEQNKSSPSLSNLLRICKILDLVIKIEQRAMCLSKTEEDALVEALARSVLQRENKVWVHINENLDIIVSLTFEIKEHSEDGYDSGTGAKIIEYVSVKIVSLDALYEGTRLSISCNKDDLEFRIAKKIMEGGL